MGEHGTDRQTDRQTHNGHQCTMHMPSRLTEAGHNNLIASEGLLVEKTSLDLIFYAFLLIIYNLQFKTERTLNG